MEKLQLEKEIKDQHDTIATLRDEIRVKLHLAGMEAKDNFEKLEKRAGQLSREISISSHRAVTEVKQHFEALARSLRDVAAP